MRQVLLPVNMRLANRQPHTSVFLYVLKSLRNTGANMKPEINYGWWWSIKCRCCVGLHGHSFAKKCYRRALRRFYKKKKVNDEGTYHHTNEE